MALTIVRDPISGVSYQALPTRAQLYVEDGSRSFSFAFAPREINYKNWEDDWVQVERVGLMPLLVRKGGKLEEISFSIVLATRGDYFASQDAHLAALQYLSLQRGRVMFRYSDNEAGLWRITSCSTASVLRHPDTNGIIRATADVTLTRALDPAPGVGPVSSSTAPAATAVAAPAPSPTRTVTVRAGDSLWSIAQRAYGNGAAWPRIYDTNRGKIAVPWLIQPGQVLSVP